VQALALLEVCLSLKIQINRKVTLIVQQALGIEGLYCTNGACFSSKIKSIYKNNAENKYSE